MNPAFKAKSLLLSPPPYRPVIGSPVEFTFRKVKFGQFFAFYSATATDDAVIDSYYPHGLTDGTRVAFRDVDGVPGINDYVFQITVIDQIGFSLNGTWDSVLVGTYVNSPPSGGWRELSEDHFFAGSFIGINAPGGVDVEIATTWNHGLETGDEVTIENVNGVAINSAWIITVTGVGNFTLDGSDAIAGAWDSTSGRWTSDRFGNANPYTLPTVVAYPSVWPATDWQGKPLLSADVIPVAWNSIEGVKSASTYGPVTRSAFFGDVNLVKEYDRPAFYGTGAPIRYPRTLILALAPYVFPVDGPLPGLDAQFSDSGFLINNIRPYGVCSYLTICDPGPLSCALPSSNRSFITFDKDIYGNDYDGEPYANVEVPVPEYIVGGDLLVVANVRRWRGPTDTPDAWPDTRSWWIDAIQYNADSFVASALAFKARFNRFRIILFTRNDYGLNNIDEIWQTACGTLAASGVDCEFRLVSPSVFYAAGGMVANEVASFFADGRPA
jgi:hypothetical protein